MAKSNIEATIETAEYEEKNYEKKIVISLITAMTVAALTGCGTKDTDVNTEESTEWEYVAEVDETEAEDIDETEIESDVVPESPNGPTEIITDFTGY